MNLGSIVIAIVVLAVFVIANVIVRIREKDAKLEREYLAALAKLKTEYERSQELSKKYKQFKSTLYV